ncbi:fimbrial protein [Serratia marcescens]|jgi:type 1 fimbria pilin|uniref:Type 1 fimbrial protein n=1 Tax=Serratia surfactantfaciens TaxID=2741499 RepID=A0ABS0LZM8_9GAMM|nr:MULTISPECIES: fimbrial protein [Serratia]AOE99970.1 fimbrial protein [Serratia surfactantfaciens]MBH1920754.1 type 1 fimbrial protein [Serratia surfactantfaciens]MTD06085.1 type 1 fimbrial protein [Serratia sp. YC16]WMW59874.1 fimbrial protein [Serratia marcescens]
MKRERRKVGERALMLALSLGVVAMPSAQADVVDNWQVEGAHGVLQVYGALTESACRLEMTSARQEIWLGETGTARMRQAGDRGRPVAFELRLMDCLRTPGGQRDARTGALVWAPNQPAVTVSFASVADSDNPQLVKAQGVSGMGLRLRDGRGRDVRLGSRGEPLLLTPGQDALSYSVAPERTAAPLMAGAYRATVDFRLNYD